MPGADTWGGSWQPGPLAHTPHLHSPHPYCPQLLLPAQSPPSAPSPGQPLLRSSTQLDLHFFPDPRAEPGPL